MSFESTRNIGGRDIATHTKGGSSFLLTAEFVASRKPHDRTANLYSSNQTHTI